MTQSPWTSHVPRGSFKPSEHVGELAFLTVLSEQEEETMSGRAMTIRANITLLDGPEAGASIPNVTLFGAPIVRDLLGTVGATRLARFGSAPSRTPGLNPAVFLTPPAEGDQELAQRAWPHHEKAFAKQQAPWASQTSPASDQPAPARATPSVGRPPERALPSSNPGASNPFEGKRPSAPWAASTGTDDDTPGF